MTSTATGPRPEMTLADRYRLRSGTVMVTGLQALVRLVLDQLRDDHTTGSNTRALITGYPGSPLAGLDLELGRQRALLDEAGVVHRPAINEELGVTAVAGSQVVSALPRPAVDGVLGVWYAKAPGVDRAGDALRHANYTGTDPRGGALAICGDDPGCKSSTIPSASEASMAALRIPVIYPGSPEEVLRLGRHAIAISRASGLWVALKIVANVADAFATVDVCETQAGESAVRDSAAAPYVHRPSAMLLPPASLEFERTLVGERLDAARATARARGLDRIVGDSEAKLGVIAAGTVYYDLREALALLGLDDGEGGVRGVRILKPELIWPLDREVVRRFAHGLSTVLVLEEKGPFLETAVRSILYDAAVRPRVLGERDEHGAPLVPGFGALDPELIGELVAPRLPDGAGRLRVSARADPHEPVPVPARTPFFCSGCPHNSSTVVPDGAVVGGGIGCHAMIALPGVGSQPVAGLTPMGNEGAQWIGQSPFTETEHIFQNLGDGTFSHSGALAIRAAVAAGVNITYKLLYNHAVAMTGGQQAQGQMPVPALVRWLESEGVRRVIVTTDDLQRYRDVKLPAIASVRGRREIVDAQEQLRAVPGVTVLIHDQACAAEKRRLRKRGLLQTPAARPFINERVCEGCGDCGRKSHCLSLVPVQTEFGTKTQIQQSSCNQDYSCIEGDCPSFIEITAASASARGAPPRCPVELPEPDRCAPSQLTTLRLIGIGGTGVVTIAQVLGMAALLDGNRVLGLDQTGLAQKGGPVISDVRIASGAAERSSRASAGSLDAYLAFDLLGALDPRNLRLLRTGEATAVVSVSRIVTGQMIGASAAGFPALQDAIRRIDDATGGASNVYLDATALAERLFGDHMLANTIVLGAAWQRGLVPISLAAIESAFTLNGVAVQANLAAFEWGRAVVADPDAVADAQQQPHASHAAPESPQARAILAATDPDLPDDGELARLVRERTADLVAYQDRAYASSYAAAVAEVRAAEARLAPGRERITAAVARNLYRLMAYKDEYEVARLHLDPAQRALIREQFGPDARVRYLLHPPLLRALGLKRKLALGPWFEPGLIALRALRRVRGTPLDPFGRTPLRRVERRLADEYIASVRAALPRIGSDYGLVLDLCEAAEEVRGYEQIKLRSIERYRVSAQGLLEQLSLRPPRGP
ncbi:MAG: indolepyruvate ferredoxin oxidoreductase family protein [Solirubrobacteraceae bacterium]